MAARVLDGRRIAEAVRLNITELAREDAVRHGTPAGLAILRVGTQDLASSLYTQTLIRTSAQLGVAARVLQLQETIADDALRQQIEALNADASI